MHGHELHGIARRRALELGHLVEPLGQPQPREERHDRRLALGVLERRHDVDEGRERIRAPPSMHSSFTRLQNVFGFFTTVACVLGAFIAATDLFTPRTPSGVISPNNVQV